MEEGMRDLTIPAPKVETGDDFSRTKLYWYVNLNYSKIPIIFLKEICPRGVLEKGNQYSLSDLEIGKITVVGIYRGCFKREELNAKLSRFDSLY